MSRWYQLTPCCPSVARSEEIQPRYQSALAAMAGRSDRTDNTQLFVRVEGDEPLVPAYPLLPVGRQVGGDPAEVPERFGGDGRKIRSDRQYSAFRSGRG